MKSKGGHRNKPIQWIREGFLKEVTSKPSPEQRTGILPLWGCGWGWKGLFFARSENVLRLEGWIWECTWQLQRIQSYSLWLRWGIRSGVVWDEYQEMMQEEKLLGVRFCNKAGLKKAIRRREGKWWKSWAEHKLLLSPAAAGVSLGSGPLPGTVCSRAHASPPSKGKSPALLTSWMVMKSKSTVTGKWQCTFWPPLSFQVSSSGWRHLLVHHIWGWGGGLFQKPRGSFSSVFSTAWKINSDSNPLSKASGLFSFCSWTPSSGHTELQSWCAKTKTKQTNKMKLNPPLV